MKSLAILCLFTALLISLSNFVFAQSDGASPGALPPIHFGPPNYGFGPFGNGVYGPGYYAPNGLGLGGPRSVEVDPSLRFGTYPGYPSASPSPLRPVLGEPFRDLSREPFPSPVTWPSRGKITIHHLPDAKEELHYTLNGLKYAIKPGYEQKFEDDRKWIIAISDAKSKTPLRYTLTAGAYRFIAKDESFDLFEEKPKDKQKDAPQQTSNERDNP